MSELSNIFSKGTEALQIDDSFLYVPLNEDYCFLAEVLSYDPAYGKMLCKKVWDPDGSKTFIVRALYSGQSGTPTSSEVVAGQKTPVYRVGVGNNNFSALSESLQLHDSNNTTKVSFVSFFFP